MAQTRDLVDVRAIPPQWLPMSVCDPASPPVPQLLQSAYNRCCSVLSKSSRPEDVAVQVCSHVSRCYTVAAQFQQCRDKLIEMPQIIQDLCRVLYYKVRPRAGLCRVLSGCGFVGFDEKRTSALISFFAFRQFITDLSCAFHQNEFDFLLVDRYFSTEYPSEMILPPGAFKAVTLHLMTPSSRRLTLICPPPASDSV